MLQNLFYSWFGSTFLFKIWRIYGKCQKHIGLPSPTVTSMLQTICAVKPTFSLYFVGCRCLYLCLYQNQIATYILIFWKEVHFLLQDLASLTLF